MYLKCILCNYSSFCKLQGFVRGNGEVTTCGGVDSKDGQVCSEPLLSQNAAWETASSSSLKSCCFHVILDFVCGMLMNETHFLPSNSTIANLNLMLAESQQYKQMDIS